MSELGVHQGSVLSPLLFVIVLEALSREFSNGLPMELFSADDFVLVPDTELFLLEKLKKRRYGLEIKVFLVNASEC